MLLLLASLLISSSIVTVHSSDPPALVEELAKILVDNYCNPEKLESMKAILGSAVSIREIMEIQNMSAMASAMTSGIQNTLGDPRVIISYEPDYVPVVPPALPPLPPEQLVSVLKGSIQLDVLENNIGYLRIDHIIGEEMAEKIGQLLVENVWNHILSTSALIFDLRHTGAGEFSGIPYIVSYFTEAEPLIHIYTIYDHPSNTTAELWSMPTLLGKRYGTRKELVILTSKHTTGAAEAVAYALKSLKRATIVGEKTGGGSVKIDKLQVGETGFYATLPTAKAISAFTGESWELTGVTPCIEADAEGAVEAAVKVINLREEVPNIVKEASSLVAEHYAFPETGADVAEKLLGLVEKGHYKMIASEAQLEALLSADLKELSGDKNLKTTKPTTAAMPSLTAEMMADMVKRSFQTDVFEDNIGYLRYDMFGDFETVAPAAKDIVEHAWSKIVHTNAMIIDLRNNAGGHTSALSGFCSYFFDGGEKILLDTLYHRPSNSTQEMWTLETLTGERYGKEKSVIILTSGRTAGAAEEFVYIMKKLGRAVVVGEVTHGGSHPPEIFLLGDSAVYLSVPVTHSDTVHGATWEGTGIAPHVLVPSGNALEMAQEMLHG